MPAEVLVVSREDFGGGAAASLFALLVLGFGDIEHAGEEQEGDLLDDLERVGNAAGPELFPELIDFVAEVAGNHVVLGNGLWEKCSHHGEEIFDLVFALKDAFDAIAMDGGEGRVIKLFDADAAVFGDFLLEHGEELGLRGGEGVTDHELAETGFDGLAVHAGEGADEVVKVTGGVGVELLQGAEVGVGVLGEDKGDQGVEVGMGDGFGAADLLECGVMGEEVLEGGEDALFVDGHLVDVRDAAMRADGDCVGVFGDVGDAMAELRIWSAMVHDTAQVFA